MKNKILSRIFACAMTLSIATVGFAGMPAAKASAASQPVQLKNAYTWFYGDETSAWNTSGEIDVQKLGTDKQVTIHYTSDGTNWYDLSATYVKDDPSNPGYEIWKFNHDYNKLETFTIKYTVNGTTYWDNNNGSNYTFTDGTASSILGQDAVKYYTAAENGYTGYKIYAKNLGYTKSVGVRYTTDNWATYTDVNATFAKSQDGNVDVFNLPSIPVRAQFAVYYTVNGTTYWDNNDGANYQITF